MINITKNQNDDERFGAMVMINYLFKNACRTAKQGGKMAEISIEVYCSCGNGLCHQTKCKRSGEITVEPCKNCLKEKYNEGYEDGYEQAKKEEEEDLT
ncbi:MAG: hypothetical protein ABIG69_04070 [Bacteroidota bacterium]